MRAGHEVDRDRVVVARDGERRGLACRLDECDEMGSCHLPDVEAREDGVREVDEPDAEPVPAGRVDALDEP